MSGVSNEREKKTKIEKQKKRETKKKKKKAKRRVYNRHLLARVWPMIDEVCPILRSVIKRKVAESRGSNFLLQGTRVPRKSEQKR